MKIFGVTLGKEKPVGFTEFRDVVRLAVRRQHPNATIEYNETGIVLTLDGKKQDCNMRNLYMEYSKNPGEKDSQVQRWISSLVVDVPEHGWYDAQATLRPTIKNLRDYILVANSTMQRANPPDSLPYAPFIGDIGVIVMRDLPGTAVAVTNANLEAWGITFEEAMQAAIMNMNMLSFPPVSNALVAGGTARKDSQEEVGLVLEGDHLTATWLVIERFRDYISQRLEGDFVAFVPIRNRLVVIRADEPGLISQIQQSNRTYNMQSHSITPQAYHVSTAVTGGTVTIYQQGLNQGDKVELDHNSMFARGNAATLPSPGVQPTNARPAATAPVDLSAWGGLTETTEEGGAPRVRTPFDQGGA